MRRMLDLSDINSVAGKKLYLHEIKFSYSSSTQDKDIDGNYFAWFISPINTKITSGIEEFRRNSIFLRGNKDGELHFQIVMFPDGNSIIAFGVLNIFNYQSPVLLLDDNEIFTIISDTVTE